MILGERNPKMLKTYSPNVGKISVMRPIVKQLDLQSVEKEIFIKSGQLVSLIIRVKKRVSVKSNCILVSGLR